MTDDDPQISRRFERLERLFVLTDPRSFAEHALLALLDAAEARSGYVILQGDDPAGAPLLAAARGREVRQIEAGLTAAGIPDALCRRLAHPEAITLAHPAPLAPIGAPLAPQCFVSVRIEHPEAHARSLWVLGRDAPFDAPALAEIAAITPAIQNLGALVLPRLSGGVTGHYARSALVDCCDGAATRRPAAPDPLEGLPRIAADCARLAARGYTNKQIGAYLLMAESVVARYLTIVYRHLEIETRYQLDAERLLDRKKPAPRTPRDPLPSAA
ncbi:MAG: hypothetical protein H6701_11525 [Myxococcales bacterium]|nr:hypothetical protein [Myxococcales bacterium]